VGSEQLLVSNAGVRRGGGGGGVAAKGMWRLPQGAVNMESRSLPALRDFCHDGIGCVNLLYSSSWKCHQLAAEQLLPGQTVYSLAAKMIRIIHHSSDEHVPGRTPCRVSHL
jgi:hypothetical protein